MQQLWRCVGIGAVLVACDGAGKVDDDVVDTDVDASVCAEPSVVPCEDELALDVLSGSPDASAGAVVTVRDGDDFVTTIDATAGGLQAAATSPWVYLRFAADGAEAVRIDDESALTSMDWHLAARRFLLRLNGGNSGPSCVGASVFLERAYEDVTDVPADVSWTYDAFYTTDCTLINDSSGLEDSPQLALSPYWSYPGCVAMTYRPFLVQLDDGGVIKLVVESYYQDAQEACDTTGTMGSGSANFTLRWSWVVRP